MLKLIKWTAIGAVAVTAGGLLMFGPQFGSYVGTAAGSLRQGIAESIPIDFELQRARALITEIDPQLHGAKRELAQAEVDLMRVQEDVERLEQEIEKGERKLKTVSTALRSPRSDSPVQLAGWERRRVEVDLERSFENHKNNVALLDGKRALIERQSRAVLAARSHLDAVRAEKARLEDMVASLTTQKRQLDALAASSRSFDLDDTALGRAREVLNEVKNRLDVAQRMLEDEIFVVPVITAPRGDVVAEIEEFFAEDPRSEVAAEVIELR